MNKKRIVFILNPISGTISKAGIPDLIEERLNKSEFDYNILETQYAGHATELAKQAVKEGVNIVVAVGGDGTVNEIGKSLINTSTAMAILPCGSGNGLARHLNLPMNLKKCIDIINECEIRALDYGIINVVWASTHLYQCNLLKLVNEDLSPICKKFWKKDSNTNQKLMR